MDQTQRNALRYVVELALVMGLFAALLFLRRPLLRLDYGPLWADAVLLSPALPLWGAFWVIVRHYRRLDEYLKLELLQIIAISTGFAACLAASYGFLRDAFHLPEISIGFAWNVIAMCWLVATFVVHYRNRRRFTCTTA
jgi:hypothetical protein